MTLPQYLDRSEIVRRRSVNQLDLAEFDQWAEPLKGNLTRVQADNLSRLLSTNQVEACPWSRSTPFDYQVVVEVTRFEGTVNGDSRLTARWTILDGAGRQERVRRQSDVTVTPDRQDYEATERHEAMFDLTHPYYRSGSAIAVPIEGTGHNWLGVVQRLFTRQVLGAMGVLLDE